MTQAEQLSDQDDLLVDSVFKLEHINEFIDTSNNRRDRQVHMQLTHLETMFMKQLVFG